MTASSLGIRRFVRALLLGSTIQTPEVTLRLISSAVGYCSLVLMLRSPEPIRTFALYLPSSILVTLALDLGRGETALRQGLSQLTKRRAHREMWALAVGSMSILCLLPFSAMPPRAKALIALVLSGSLQAYVDIDLRLCLFKHRRSLYLYLYSFGLNCVSVVVAGAIAFGLMEPTWGLGVCVMLPVGAVTVFAHALRRLPGLEERDTTELESPKVLLASVLYRAFPPGAYTVYATLLTKATPELAVSARALYFVFGFIHTRRMAREAGRTTVLRTGALLFVLTSLLSIPLLLLAAQRPRADWHSVGVCAVITCCASLAFSWFLARYTAFVNGAVQPKGTFTSAA